MIRPIPRFKYVHPPIAYVVGNYKIVRGKYEIVDPTNLGIISEPNLLKKIQKIGTRNHKPTEVIVKFRDDPIIQNEFSVNSKYPTKEEAQEALVEFLSAYSMKGNIVGCNTIKRSNLSGLKIIVAPTNDYSYSNITAEMIDSIIQSVNWSYYV